MLRALDLVVILADLVGSAALGLYLSGKQTDLKDYFLGSRALSW